MKWNEMICKECGDKFLGRSNSKYCYDCKAIVTLRNDLASKKRKKQIDTVDK